MQQNEYTMTKNGKCLWIIDKLLRSDGLSLRDLNNEWEASSLYDGTLLHERTFGRYKEFISSEYAIDIEYSHSTKKYFIANADEVRHNTLYNYLLSAYRVASLNTHIIRHKEQMMFEPIPTGVEYLETLLKAIEDGRTVQFDYRSFYRDEPTRDWEVIPCFLRIFEGRWYLIAELTNRSDTRRLALERISALRITEHCLTPSPYITSKDFFDGCYGIIRESHLNPQLIYLKADAQQRNYLRAQPLHESQEEVETAENYSIFTYHVRPSFDFYQRVLWMREKVCIIAPDNVRDELAVIIQKMAEMYGIELQKK